MKLGGGGGQIGHPSPPLGKTTLKKPSLIRFKIFVANRVGIIRENSQVIQWFYVNTKENPAGLSSRSINTIK